jgi:hypothetical protein
MTNKQIKNAEIQGIPSAFFPSRSMAHPSVDETHVSEVVLAYLGKRICKFEFGRAEDGPP